MWIYKLVTSLLYDTVVSRSRLSAAHVCYHVGGAHLSQWDDSQCKFSLLGVNHRQQSVTSSPDPSMLWKTEVNFICCMAINILPPGYSNTLRCYAHESNENPI